MSNEELVIRIRQGDTEAKNELWGNVQKLVYIFCRPYQAYATEKYLETDDLINAAWLGVERAIMAYQEERGVCFNTCMKYYVQNAVRELLGLRGSREPDTVSLNTPVNTEENLCLADMLEEKNVAADLEMVDNASASAWLWDRVDRLPEPERDVIFAYYRDNISLSEQGRRNGCSYQAMAERKNSGLNMLRKDRELKRYYNEVADLTLNVSLKTFKRTWTSSVELAVLKMEE